MKIKILGTGCPRCKRLEELTRRALRDLGLQADVVHVTDMQAIMAYPIMAFAAGLLRGEARLQGCPSLLTPDRAGQYAALAALFPPEGGLL